MYIVWCGWTFQVVFILFHPKLSLDFHLCHSGDCSEGKYINYLSYAFPVFIHWQSCHFRMSGCFNRRCPLNVKMQYIPAQSHHHQYHLGRALHFQCPHLKNKLDLIIILIIIVVGSQVSQLTLGEREKLQQKTLYKTLINCVSAKKIVPGFVSVNNKHSNFW